MSLLDDGGEELLAQLLIIDMGVDIRACCGDGGEVGCWYGVLQFVRDVLCNVLGALFAYAGKGETREGKVAGYVVGCIFYVVQYLIAGEWAMV